MSTVNYRHVLIAFIMNNGNGGNDDNDALMMVRIER